MPGVREAVPADYCRMKSVAIDALDDLRGEYEDEDVDQMQSAFTIGRFAIDTKGTLLVTTEERRVVGWCRFVLENEAAEITSLYVAPDYSGRGHGKRLVEAVADRIRGEADVIAVAAALTAVGFYRSVGFERVEDDYVTRGELEVTYAPMARDVRDQPSE